MKTFKRFYLVFGAALLLLEFAAGCATVQKKFTRKKKEAPHTPTAIYLQAEGPYQKKFSNEYYYKSHFTLWKSWHGDLIGDFGGNAKRAARSAEEALGHLREMSEYLQSPKKEELAPHEEELAKIVRRVSQKNYSDSEIGGMKMDLGRILRIVSNNFYYNKIKENLIPDEVELGA